MHYRKLAAVSSWLLLLAMSGAATLHAQARKWLLPDTIIDFGTSPPTASGLPLLEPYRVANGAFDGSGKLLFYVRQEGSRKLQVFDSDGNKIDELVNAAAALQIVVVPVPLSCDRKYYIVYFARQVGAIGPHAPFMLTYSVFDTQTQSIDPQSRNVQVPPGRLGGSFWSGFGTAVATPLRSGTTRFLYALNNDVVDKFVIGPGSISLEGNVLEFDSNRGLAPVQAALASDGHRLAVATRKGILIVALDSQGDFSGSTELDVAIPAGLAFSRDGGMLVFSNPERGLGYVRFVDPEPLTPTFLPGSEAYGISQLQLAVDDKIYAVTGNSDSDLFDLGAVNVSGSTPSFEPATVVDVLAGTVFGAGTDVWTLPAQIDGEPLCSTPALVQSTYGARGNFEVVVPAACGGLAHFWRDNDDPSLPWHGPFPFAAAGGAVDAVSMIQSNYGNLEVVARIGDRLAHFWRGGVQWYGTGDFAAGVSGTPSLVQGKLGAFGNFEVVTPLATGGLAHYERDNDSPSKPWREVGEFGFELGVVDDVSLVQSTVGSLRRNLEAVVRVGDRLVDYWREEDGAWRQGGFFASGISGTPSFIQGNFANPGGPGNFELVAPLATGGMAHYWRGEDRVWRGPNRFGSGIVRSVSLIQSNFGQNFEVVARRNCSLVPYWRSDAAANPPWTWYGSPTIIP
ncbi:MAG TPA: hypothetical protein VGS57_19815 [Thermoanaerobaculia bacterium]|jgi:hypothetical protein|nr:hypothetical protein [Thermoanaerobaculia bacterium]